jgi:hypothetical protein
MRATRWVLSTGRVGFVSLQESFAPLPACIRLRNRQASRERKMRCSFSAVSVVD